MKSKIWPVAEQKDFVDKIKSTDNTFGVGNYNLETKDEFDKKILEHLNDYAQARLYLERMFGKGTIHNVPIDNYDTLVEVLVKVVKHLLSDRAINMDFIKFSMEEKKKPDSSKVILIHSWSKGIFYVDASNYLIDNGNWEYIAKTIREILATEEILNPNVMDFEFVVIQYIRIVLSRNIKKGQKVVGAWKVEDDTFYIATKYTYNNGSYTFDTGKFITTYYKDGRIHTSVKSIIDIYNTTDSDKIKMSASSYFMDFNDSHQIPPNDDGETKIGDEGDMDIWSEQDNSIFDRTAIKKRLEELTKNSFKYKNVFSIEEEKSNSESSLLAMYMMPFGKDSNDIVKVSPQPDDRKTEIDIQSDKDTRTD